MKYLKKLEEAKKKARRKPTPGAMPYSKGSCVKEAYKLIGLALIEAKADDGLTDQQKIQIRVRRTNDAPDELEQKTRKGPVGDMARSKGVRQDRVTSARDTRVNHPKRAEGKKFAKNREQEAVLKKLKTTNKFYKVPVKKKKGKKGK